MPVYTTDNIKEAIDCLEKGEQLTGKICEKVIADLENLPDFFEKNANERGVTEMNIEELFSEFTNSADNSKRILQSMLYVISEGKAPDKNEIKELDLAIEKLGNDYQLICATAKEQLTEDELPDDNSSAEAYVNAIKNSSSLQLVKQIEEMKKVLQDFIAVRSLVANYATALEPYQKEAEKLLASMEKVDKAGIDALATEIEGPEAFLKALECEDLDSDAGIDLLDNVGEYYPARVTNGVAAHKYYIDRDVVENEETPVEKEDNSIKQTGSEAEIIPEENTDIEESVEDSAEPQEELSEFTQSVIDRGLIIDADYNFGFLKLDKSEKESKKFGVKEFKNDLNVGCTAIYKAIFKQLGTYGYVTEELIASVIPEDVPTSNIEKSFEMLFKKGYLRKYSLVGRGHFYVISNKGNQAYASKDASSFLGYKRPKHEEEGVPCDDIASAAAVRLILTKSISDHHSINRSDSYNIGCMTATESFSMSLRVAETGDKTAYFAALWTRTDEIYLGKMQLDAIFEDDNEIHRIVIAGLDIEGAKKLLSFVKESYDLSKIERVLLYAYDEEKYYDSENDEIVDIADIWKIDSDEEGSDAENETDELKNSDGEDETEIKVEDLPKIKDEKEENVKEVEAKPVVTDEPAKDEKKSAVVKVDKVEVIVNSDVVDQVYAFLAAKKHYCATAYLRAAAMVNSAYNVLSSQLSFALNDPAARCHYEADRLFEVYFKEAEEDQYFILSAAIRNFFYNQSLYDYNIKILYSNIKTLPALAECGALDSFIYDVMSFKDEQHRGMDAFADYRMMDKIKVERQAGSVREEAKDFYKTTIEIQFGDSIKRLKETKKLIFSKNGDFGLFMKAVVDGEMDPDTIELIKDFLQTKFIKSDSSIDVNNIDKDKIETLVNDSWEEARNILREKQKSTPLLGGRRQNLINSIQRGASILCRWINIAEATSADKESGELIAYKKIRNRLLQEGQDAITYFTEKGNKAESIQEKGGIAVLVFTLSELVSRMEGSYDERSQKYFYADFLKTEHVLLDEVFIPVLDKNFIDNPELSIMGRIINHSNSELTDLDVRIHEIFEMGGDDYGTARLIHEYYKDLNEEEVVENFDKILLESISFAQKDADDSMRRFEEDLELAQSYGQFDYSASNEKENMLQIASAAYQDACLSENYGYFRRVIQAFKTQIKTKAESRGQELILQLENYKKQLATGEMTDEQSAKLDKIQKMLEVQNFTVAEDMLRRIDSYDMDGSLDITAKDYLLEFISKYDYYYRRVADSGKSLKAMISVNVHNRDKKGADKLLSYWNVNGQPFGKEKVSTMMECLGFAVDTVAQQPKIDSFENYTVNIRKPINGRKMNLRHPIAAFGSLAPQNGFRVVCMSGRLDSNRLIERIRGLGASKNTIILIDYAFTADERRKLARKIKTDVQDKIFAIIDRVVLYYLIENYNDDTISKMLMSVVMPYAYYQPYIWSSDNTMPPELFMGRKKELSDIESPTGVNIVYGGRQLGKSALLKMAKNDINNDENGNRAVLIDIKGKNYKEVCKKVCETLYDEGILDTDLQTEDWEVLARAVKKRLADPGKQENIPYLLLLMDEADAFTESCIEVNYKPFDALKDMQSIGTERFKFVIAGLRNIIKFHKETALAENSVMTHLHHTTVRPFNPTEARELLEIPLYYLGLRFTDKDYLMSLIFAKANYFPGLIQLYCAKLVESMRNQDYAGYSEINTPPYEVNENHIKKVLADKEFTEQVREKFEITLKLDEDSYYYIIALLLARLNHEGGDNNGYTPQDIYNEGCACSIAKIERLNVDKVQALMEELISLNILRKTPANEYMFNKYSFFKMMGTIQEVDDKLVDYMEV